MKETIEILTQRYRLLFDGHIEAGKRLNRKVFKIDL